MSLRSRLAVLFGLVALVASALVGAISYRSTASELRDSTDRFLEQRADETVQAVLDRGVEGRLGDNNPGRRSPNRPNRIDNGLPVADDDAIIQITGPGGARITSSSVLPATDASEALRVLRPGRTSQPVTQFEDITIDGEPYRMLSQSIPQGGVIQVARSIGEAEALESVLIGRFVAIAAVVALVAAGLGWLIAARATAPLRRLSMVASEVAATRDFTTDVGEANRNDEIGRLASGFATMLDTLEASRVQQHRLVHDAGHEMRTPLTSLRANVAMLERAGELPSEDREEILAAIRSELIELSDLFDEMIDLATDQREADMVFEQVDLAWLVGDVAARWERRSGRTIEIEVSSSLVMGEAVMLERAVGNLVSNADKFSPPGAPITMVSADGMVSVRDAGPGIPAADLDRIFDRFYRSDVTRSMPGSGLGLSIVAQIVRRHGGQVWARNADGGGAEVGLRLQVVADADSVSDSTSTSGATDSGSN